LPRNSVSYNKNMQKSDPEIPPGEVELVTRSLDGDRAGFEQLIRPHESRLKRLLRGMLGDPFDAEDVYQETLLRAYLNLEQLREPSKFGAWIYSIAANLARSWRLPARTSHLTALEGLGSDPSEEESLPTSSMSSEALLIQEDENRQLRQAVEDLPPAEREAVLLVYLGGMSHKEAAEQLGATLNAVKVRVHRGRRHLQAALDLRAETETQKDYKEVDMVEVNIYDVLVHFNETEPAPIPTELDAGMKKIISRLDRRRSYVVLLKETAGERALPIWIGAFEAESIVMILSQAKAARPITFDLIKTLISLGNLHIIRFEINRLHEKVFYANMVVQTEEGVSEVDCRPSDALNLAVRLGAPIFAAPEILDSLDCLPAEDGAYTINPDNPEMEWESLLRGEA